MIGCSAGQTLSFIHVEQDLMSTLGMLYAAADDTETPQTFR